MCFGAANYGEAWVTTYTKALVAMLLLNLCYVAFSVVSVYEMVTMNQSDDVPSYEFDETRAPLRFLTGLGSALLAGVVRSIAVLVVWYLRRMTRHRFKIQIGCCSDCVAVCCCSCCAIAQIATHVKSYKPGHCDFTFSVDTLPPYKTFHATSS